MTIDSAGNIYLGDSPNQRIELIDTLGIIHSIVGTGIHGYCCDGGPATAAEINYPENVVLDGCGNLYIADFENARVRKVTFNSSCVDSTLSLTCAKTSNLFLYPNPAYDAIHLHGLSGNTTYTITDMPGKILLTGTVDAIDNTINVNALPQGVYILQLIGNGGSKTVYKIVRE